MEKFTREEKLATGVALQYIAEHTTDDNLRSACESALAKLED